jgi:prefoldin alpha subunit
MVTLTIKDVETALVTIAALKDEPSGIETLVPIGFGSFVKANLVNTDTIVVGIGAGVSIEKKIEDAKSFLEKRKDELTKYYEQLKKQFKSTSNPSSRCELNNFTCSKNSKKNLVVSKKHLARF